MKNYIIMRLLATVPLLLGISVPVLLSLSTLSLPILPRWPCASSQTPVDHGRDSSPQTRAEQLGLDQPLLVRYAHWLLGLPALRPGRELHQSCHGRWLGEIAAAVCLRHPGAGRDFSLVYCHRCSAMPIGFLSAVYKDSMVRPASCADVVFATTAMPAYWVGLLLIWIVGVKLDLAAHQRQRSMAGL